MTTELYKQKGLPHLLESARQGLRAVLRDPRLKTASDVVQGMTLINISACLLDCYRSTGDADDLDSVIEAATEHFQWQRR